MDMDVKFFFTIYRMYIIQNILKCELVNKLKIRL